MKLDSKLVSSGQEEPQSPDYPPVLFSLADRIGALNSRLRARKRYNYLRAWASLGDEEKLARAVTMLEIEQTIRQLKQQRRM